MRARFGDDGGDPFAGVARLTDGERIAPHFGRIEAVHQRVVAAGKLLAGQHIMHAGHRQRRRGVDRDDARGRIRRRHDARHAACRRAHVGDEMALAGDEAAILAHAALRRDVAEGAGRSSRIASRASGGTLATRAGARRRAQSRRRSGRSRCSGRYCRRSPRRSARASVRDCRAAARAQRAPCPACNSRIACRASRRSVLDQAQLARRRRDAFDGGDSVAVGLHREHQAGARRLAVEQHGAGAADAVLAAGMRAGEARNRRAGSRAGSCAARRRPCALSPLTMSATFIARLALARLGAHRAGHAAPRPADAAPIVRRGVQIAPDVERRDRRARRRPRSLVAEVAADERLRRSSSRTG